MLSKPELDCLLNGKEPTPEQIAGVRLMSVRHHEPINYATLVERLNARKERESAIMEELASQRQEIDELRDHLHQLLARVANKRLKLGK